MSFDEVIYADLFAFLQRLGFVDSSKSDFERIFKHAELGIVLAFAMMDDPRIDRPVRSADLVSTEMRLQHQGQLTGKLRDAIAGLREHR